MMAVRRRGAAAVLALVVVAVACSTPEKERAPEERTGSTASALTTARYEGEDMAFSGTGEVRTTPAPAHRYFWTDGHVAQSHAFYGGSTTIRVRAQGELLAGVGPHVVVTVGGTEVGSAYVNETSYTTKSFTFDAPAGVREIQVLYDNDDESVEGDRNLLLDWIEVEETPSCSDATYEAEAMSWSGVEDEDGEIRTGPPAHRYFWTDSYIYQNHTFVAGPTRIRVRAMGELFEGVGPHMVVSVGGVQIGSTYVDAGAYVEETFDFEATAGTQEIRVTYDNDDWADPGDPGNDRNLLVDKVEVLCGASPDGGSPDGGGSSDGGSSDGGMGESDAAVDASVPCVPANCDDSESCTEDRCTELGCVHDPLPSTEPCSTGSSCSNGDHCDGQGACVSGGPVVCSPSNPCMIASCDPALGCTNTPLPAGTACGSDEDACSGVSTCDAHGSCQPGVPLTCTSNNACMIAACDPVLGCVSTAAPLGTPCGSVANLCQTAPTCDGAGTCTLNAPPTCASENPCMIGACDPEIGCVFTPVADGTACDSDMNACNGQRVCSAGQCADSPPPTCTSTDPCLVASCEPTSGCVLYPAPPNTPGCASVIEPPPLAPTVPVRMAAATAFLYSGSSPVQTGVAPGTIVSERVAVVRGRVLDADGATPKQGATVTIVGHPEYGQTRTRESGEFDLAVNGGTTYVVAIQAPNYLPVQRSAKVGWHGWAVVDDVVLTQPQSSPDIFVSGAPTTQIVRGLVTPGGEDADDARQAVIIFPENTHFTNYAITDGTPLEVQVTEYTRGPQGLQRMPGELPPTVGYTYAFELGFPAATAAGVRDVKFDRDVPVYVDNFTHYPVGENVPLGYYSHEKGAWMAERSGRILKVLSTSAGEATVDVTGDGVADTGPALSELGITTSELRALAAQYAAGTELWRVSLHHFSTWDCNWGFGAPDDAGAPPHLEIVKDSSDRDCQESGSIIGCESRTLGEAVPINGTSFNLRYQSNRAPGYKSRIQFRLTDASLPTLAPLRIQIEIEVAGRHLAFERLPPFVPNDTFTWMWDGRDAYGREVASGSYDARIRLGYEYAGVTRSTANFGVLPGVAIGGDRAARKITLWRENTVPVERAAAAPLGFGGWTLDINHIFDPENLILYKGDGSRRQFAKTGSYVLEKIAGLENSPSFPDPDFDNVPAGTRKLEAISSIARGPDGSIYVGTFAAGRESSARLRRIAPDGIISSLTGVPPVAAKVDGGPALHARTSNFYTPAIGPDGSVYFAERADHQVWKVTPGPTPTLHHVAGNGRLLPPQQSFDCLPPAASDCGDGGDARDADLRYPEDIAVANDGTIFIGDFGHNRIRRVGPEGRISTYYQMQGTTFGGSLALRADGTLFALDNGIRRIDPSGSVTTLPGRFNDPEWCQYYAHAWQFLVPLDDDSFAFACNRFIDVKVSAGKHRIGGGGTNHPSLGGPAIRADLMSASSLVAGEHGEFFFLENGGSLGSRIRRMHAPNAHGFGSPAVGSYRVPSDDGGEVYEFDLDGKHVRTLAGRTGALLVAFGYDNATGELVSVTDGDANVVSVSRTVNEVQIVAPHGQVTRLALDVNKYLASVTAPQVSETAFFAHANDGLLTDLVDPSGNAHHFEYADDGRLTKDVDALAGSNGKRLTTTFDTTGWTVDVSSAEGRVTRYRTERGGDFGDPRIVERRTIAAAPSGAALTEVIETFRDQSRATKRPDGTKVTVLSTAPDPRWRGAVTFASSVRVDVGFPSTTHSMTRTESRTATLTVPTDPFSLSGETITTTLSGAGVTSATVTRVFAAGPQPTWTITTAAGRQVRSTLDARSRITGIEALGSDPVTLEPIQFQYDDRGRIDQITHGARVYTTSYDPTTGWIESTSDPAGLGVSYASRDANGRPKLVNLPGGRSLALAYDLNGNVVSVTPPSKPAHGVSWDQTDRITAYQPPDLGFTPKDTTFQRDHDGFILSMAKAGLPETFEYDGVGRLQQMTDAVTKTYTYDPQGRISTIATSDGVTMTNTYDGSLLRQQAVSGPFSHALNKTHDNLFRVSAWNVDGVNAVSLTYDRDNYLTAAGGMTLTRGNNGLLKSTTVGVLEETFAYNAYSEISGHVLGGSPVGYAAAYTRDAAGRIETKVETLDGIERSERYSYDAAGRLWQVFVDGASTPEQVYGYDPNGNRDDGTYDAQDRQLTHDGFTFAYGPNGERTKKTDDVTLAETDYVYDTQGNLRTVTRPAPLAAITYVIDGLNRRIGKKVGGSFVQGFLYDGAKLIAELDASGAVVARFIYGMSDHSPDLMLKAGVMYRFIKDQLGSPRLVINSANGVVAQRMDFDAWGNATSDTSPGFQPFGFAGGLWDRDTGLVRFGARDYDPTTGRWTSKDASRFGGGLNFYAYANNDPVNYVDPNGHYAVPVPVLFAGVVLAALYYALNSPTHDGSVVAGAPIMVAPAVGWAAGGALAGATAPAMGGALTCGGSIVARDPQTLSRMIEDADRRGLNAWFKGTAGPEQISTGALKVYQEIAHNALNDPNKASPTAIVEQSRRLDMITTELSRR